MTARGLHADAVALHPQGAVVNLTERHALQTNISGNTGAEPLHNSPHAAQVAQAFFAHSSHHPKVPGEPPMIGSCPMLFFLQVPNDTE